ncbi:MAG TPA: tRNA pseudouridine(55) synthase TruB [Candidatus Saccharimonadales bacterium]|jgi:tRNA pseudouridine55 synthase
MQGILLIDKPREWTSFDVVNYVRRQVAQLEGKKPKNCKVGHTGTLDPLATGLLILVVGKEYTRRAGEFSKLDKTYEVTMKLGETSTTGDEEGTKSAGSTNTPTEQQITDALRAFTGDIMQTPPAFSAMKINGVRAYKLAREGKTVAMEARPVTIYSNTLTAYDYPFITFVSAVSSGTYIRSLVEDIGRQLETGAYMSDLRRTKVGVHSIADATEVENINMSNITLRLLTLPATETIPES